MKHFFPILIACFFFHQTSSAQVIFEEDFESIYIAPQDYMAQLPASFTQYSDPNTVYWTFPFSDPWLVQRFYPEQAAVCPTNFNPAGQADRWMITPAITLTSNNNLIWRSKIYWNQIPEAYEVRLSTTGTAIADFGSVLLTTVMNDSDEYRMHSISLAAWSGQTVYIAFRMHSVNGWYFYMDEMRVEDGTANDAAVIGTDFKLFEPTGTNPVSFKVFNNSANPITSLNLNYDVNGGPVQTQTLTSQNIPAFDTMDFIHSIPWNMLTTGYHTVRLWTSNINGGTDCRTANDTFTVRVGLVSQVAPKRVMVEEHTGAWCGYCVDGSYHLELLENAYPWVIPYAIHSSDGMSFTEGNIINSNVPAYPSGFFDRYPFHDDDGFWGYSDRTEWDGYTQQRYTAGTPCDVSVTHTYNSATRQVNGTVTSTFYGNFNGEFRMNLFVVEDSVSEGTGSQWDQTNYYSSQQGGYGGPNHPYYNLPSPIVNYQHRHVCRAMVGTAWGAPGSISAVGVSDGAQYSWNFSYTLPANFDESEITLVGLVQGYDASDYTQRPIYNSASSVLIAPNGIASAETVSAVSVYPNPSADGNFMIHLQLDKTAPVQWTLTDLTGKTVAVSSLVNFTGGEHFIPVSEAALPAGVYLLSVTTGETVHTMRIVSTK